MGDFRCGKGFLALCGAGCPHLFSKPDRVTAHKVIGFCLLKDLVEHPSCLADVRIGASVTAHPFQEVFNVDGAYDGQGAMIESFFEHFQAVFIAFLCRGSDIILVTLETVVLLSKGKVDSKKIRVEFSLEDMDMSEFQDGATYPQIKEYVLEHTGLKVSNLYISQIKRKCGIEVGKNYNLPKSEDSRQPQCPPEKEKAIREAFKYFGMI